MKMILTLVFFLSIIGMVGGQKLSVDSKPQKVTKLQIIESVFLNTEHRYTIAGDSIIVDFSSESHDLEDHFVRTLQKDQINELLSSFSNVYLSQIKPEYEGKSSVDHDWTYDIIITKGETVKSTRIYKYRFAPMLIFSKKLNLLLPPKFKISYTSTYFEE